MIPKRAGGAPSPLSMAPTLPPIPENAQPTVQSSPVEQAPLETVVVAANSANAILDALRKFTSASPKSIVSAGTLEMLKGKGLICVVGNYAVVSEKGLNYLVDFNLLA